MSKQQRQTTLIWLSPTPRELALANHTNVLCTEIAGSTAFTNQHSMMPHGLSENALQQFIMK